MSEEFHPVNVHYSKENEPKVLSIDKNFENK
jgi:hypothetical protein